MSYAVKSVYATIQGEGANVGRAAVFIRLAGCNLWSGRAEDRGRGPGGCSSWCDTDFLGIDGPRGGRYRSAADLARIAAACGRGRIAMTVLTGGEPALQADDALVAALREAGFSVAIETNGTRPLPAGLGWVAVSPKSGAELAVTSGDELKIAWPQPGLDLESLARLNFAHRWLQPIDGPGIEESSRACVAHCLNDPRWRLSVQAHKVVGLP